MAESLSQLAQLRILVACLGESGDAPWWPTQFTTAAGLEFLQGVFPKSWASAAIGGTVSAAREVHDERIGRSGTHHLFRFEGGLERDIHREILLADQDAIAGFISEREKALAALRGLARQTVAASPGPVQVGRLGRERCPDAVSDMAAHYLDAFSQGEPVYPYFGEVRR